MKPETSSPESAVRVLKTATCSSLSGKSKLTYNVGCTAGADIQFRVVENTGTGFFSQEWISLTAIRAAFARAKSDKAITSFLLHSLYQGKSVNTPSFLLAVLKNEGLVQPSTTTRRCQECTDGVKFLAEVNALMASAGGPKEEGASAKSHGKPTAATAKVPSTKGKVSKVARK